MQGKEPEIFRRAPLERKKNARGIGGGIYFRFQAEGPSGAKSSSISSRPASTGRDNFSMKEKKQNQTHR